MQVAGIALNDIVKSTELTNESFLKKCYEFKKIRDKHFEPNFNNLFGLLITKISALSGITNEIDFATKSDLLRFIKTRCGDITLEEIYKAFELERYNEYPEKSKHFQLFGTEYFSEVIKKYRTWKTELKITKNISRDDNVLKLSSISESQKKDILKNGIIRVFKEYKENKTITEPCIHIFDELTSLGLIKLATTPKLEEYYSKKMQEAKKEIKRELEIEKATSSYIDRKTISREIEKLSNSGSNKVVVRTKKLVLKEYFDGLIKSNTEIETKLN